MGKLMVLDSKNLSQDGTNARFVYTFPNGGYQFKDDLIAVQSISQYFSTFNISVALGNNTVQYSWVDLTTYTITFPDGYYSLPDINAYIQSIMYANGHYLTRNSAPTIPIYFIQWVINTSRYAFQLNLFLCNTTLYPPASFTVGVSTTTAPAWSIPAPSGPDCPTMYIPSKFNLLVGFNVGFYPPDGPYQTVNKSYLSTVAPQILPQPVVFVYCTLVNNRAVIPNSLIFAYTPQGTQFGQIGVYEPTAELPWCRVMDGNYNQFLIELRDSLGNLIYFQDPNTTIILHTKNRLEYQEVNN